MPKALTSAAYWDATWAGMSLPRRRNPHSYSIQVAERLFRKYLPKARPDRPVRFLEVGCAPATWLAYFAEQFRYEVAGLDYAPHGVELAKKNLALCGVRGEVFEADLFHHGLPKESYDVVFSWGFIEHFKDPTQAVAKHLELLRPGGVLVLGVPNMEGLPGLMQHLLSKAVYDAHEHVTKDTLESLFRKFRLRRKFVGYVGSFGIDNLNPGRTGRLGKRKYSLEKYQQAGVRALTFLWTHLPRWEWRYSSPYVLAVGEKPAAASKSPT